MFDASISPGFPQVPRSGNGTLSRLFSLFLLALLSIVFLTPLLDKTLGDTFILPLVACYILTQWTAYFKAPKREMVTLALSVGYIAMILFYRVLGFSDATLSNYFTTTKFYFCFAFMVPIAAGLRRREIVFLVGIACCASILTMLYNFHLQQIYGSLYSMRAFRAEGIKGITTTQYLSAIMLLSGAFLAVALHPGSARRKLFFWGLFGLFAYYNLAVGQRGLVFFLSLLLYGLVFVLARPVSKNRMLVLFSLALFVAVAVVNYEKALRWMAESVSSTRLKNRIETVLYLLQNQDADADEGSFALRMQLIGTSWNTFLSSPQNFLVGVGDIRLSNWAVGNHSLFIDELARYGIVGGLFSIWLLFRLLASVRRFARLVPNSPLDMQLTAIFFVMLLRCCLGSVIEMACGVHLFITIPLLFRWCRESGEKEKRGEA